MLKQSKKLALAFLAVLFIVVFLTIPQSVHTEEYAPLSEKNILNMDSAKLLSTLQDRGLDLSRDYADNIDLAQRFVSEYTPLLIRREINPNINIFNYDQSNEMLRNLAATLEKMNLPVIKSQNATTRYALQNSTAIGLWSDSYTNYNCYAYSLGRIWGLQPGTTSNTNFNLSMSISQMADVVLEDLDSMGYWGYKTTTKPTSLPDQWFRVICIRKDTNNVDYHFMKMYGSLNSWAHKPGGTQPLKWNYSSPGSTVWSNEYVYEGTAYGSTVTYESSIYYIIYKGKNDPGIQAQSLTEEEIVHLLNN